MTIEFIKIDLTDPLGSPWNISLMNKIAPYTACMEKYEIQTNNTVYTSKEKNHQFFSKKTSATKHGPPSNVYYMEFYRNF